MFVKMDWYQETINRGLENTEESGCCLLCSTATDGCLCYNCKCRSCEYYDSYAEGFKCEYAAGWSAKSQYRYELGKKYSEYKIGEITKETSKAYYAKVNGLIENKEIWIPKSIVDQEGYIQLWFLWKRGFTKIKKTRKKQTTISDS